MIGCLIANQVLDLEKESFSGTLCSFEVNKDLCVVHKTKELTIQSYYLVLRR